MQPLDAIFSSPAVTRGDESGSEDMEISSSELCRIVGSLGSWANDNLQF